MSVKCTAKRKDGKPCTARPMTGEALCFFHSEKTAEASREAKAKGGRQTARLVPLVRVLPAETVDMEIDSPRTIIALLAKTINQVRKGEMGTQASTAIAACCSVMLKAIQLDTSDVRLAEVERRTAHLSHLSPAQLLEIVEKGQANGVAAHVANSH